MPLLGAIGNASQYSFRGTYDNYPFDIDFGDISNAEPGETYYSKFFPIEDINYKVPISITGDGEYYIGNINYNNTFDNTSVKFNTQSVTFDSKFPEIDYTTQPSYVRNKNTVALRIYGIPPIKITETLNVELQSSSLIEVPLDESINIELRDGSYSFNPNNSIDVNQRTAIGREYYGKTYSTTVTIGKKSFEWTVTTKSASGPFDFKFDDYIDSPISTEVTSNSYTVSGLSDGISYEVKILAENGTLSVNDGSFVKSSPIKNGDRIVLKDISSLIENSSTEVRLTIQVVDTSITFDTSWIVRTANYTPNSFGFNTLNNAPLNSFVTSNTVNISGLSDGIDYSVTSQSASISINGTNYVTGSATIRNGQTLTLGYQTSRKFNEFKTVTVKVANVSKTWNIRTREVLPEIDPNADKLILASPYDDRLGFYSDLSKLVRSTSGIDVTQYSSPSGSISGNDTNYYPLLSNFESKFYTHSLKTPIISPSGGDGFTRNLSGRVFISNIKPLGRNDFTLEFWVRTTGFDYTSVSDAVMWMYVNSGTTNNTGIGVAITSSIWNRTGKVLLNYVGSNNSGVYVTETNSSISLNQWNHVAVVRKNDVFSIYINGNLDTSVSSVIDIQRTSANINDLSYEIIPKGSFYMQDLRIYDGFVKYSSNFNPDVTVSSILESYDSEGIIESSEEQNLYTDSQGRILILSCSTALKDPKTLTKTLGKVLPGTDTCIYDLRWKEFLSLAQTTDGYRLAVTEDRSTTRIIGASNNNIRKMLNANILPLRNSLTDWQNGLLAHDETSGSSLTGLDYSLLHWTTSGFGYYGQSSNPFFRNPEYAYNYQTANWWILPPGVPDF